MKSLDLWSDVGGGTYAWHGMSGVSSPSETQITSGYATY